VRMCRIEADSAEIMPSRQIVRLLISG
jgi:hypothetical protein